MKKSIRFKLWTGMMLLVVIMLMLLWLFQIIFLESFYTNFRVTEIKKEAYSIGKLLQDKDNTEFLNKADYLSYTNNVMTEVYGQNGKSLFSNDTQKSLNSAGKGQMAQMQSGAKTKAIEDGLMGKESVLLLEHPKFSNKTVLISIPVELNNGYKGVLLVSMPLAPVKDTASILKKQLIIITAIMLVASLFISYVISKMFVKPIIEIKNTADKIAAGDFSGEIKTISGDEIGELARSVNYMGKELSKTEQLRKDLIANVSHELRTPLSVIIGYAETIRDISGEMPEKRSRHLDIIIKESQRLSGIVDDILSLSQMQDGMITVDLKKESIVDIIEDVAKSYDIACEKNGVALITSNIPTDSKPLIMADQNRIKQVLVNLINNSFNHTPKGGQILIRTTLLKDLDTVRVEVSDTGSGIPENELHRIWERFYQVNNDTGRRTVGTGLGLSIVKEILDKHSANYGVESKPGNGTTFTFEFKSV